MSGANARRRQKKLEKNRKKREQVRVQARRKEAELQGANLIRKASQSPFGPCWISESLDDTESEFPPIVTVVVTRRVAGLFLPHVMLVDRTCLGIKNAFTLPRASQLEVQERMDYVSDESDALKLCEPLIAQSVVFHALDYARSLGFEPNRDFRQALIEPRPEVLADTPLATPERPFFVPGPSDDTHRILRQLDLAVGAGNYDFLSGAVIQSMFDDFEDDDEFEDDFEDDDEYIEGEISEDEASGNVVDALAQPVTEWTEPKSGG